MLGVTRHSLRAAAAAAAAAASSSRRAFATLRSSPSASRAAVHALSTSLRAGRVQGVQRAHAARSSVCGVHTSCVAHVSAAQADEATHPVSGPFHADSTAYGVTTRAALDAMNKSVRSLGELPHYEPVTWSDRVAYSMVWSLRRASKLFYREKYTHYATVLETVAAVPGMVAGMLHHFRALRRMESNNWVKALLDEAENERMHLMTFVQLAKPTLAERLFVMSAQGVFATIFGAFYILSPRTAHRFVGYLEEEACKSYTEMLASIDAGRVPNPPAPEVAVRYWGLPADATLRDVILVVRADEMQHRDVNHGFAVRLDENGQRLGQ